jgi:hypothetical protein
VCHTGISMPYTMRWSKQIPYQKAGVWQLVAPSTSARR